MADPINYENPDRDSLQAIIALKKGTQLIKYSRKGKPKVCPFRLSSDETSLNWLSHKKERSLKLASVIKIIPGQRTAVFRRFPRPEKDYLSFSLIYKNGERSLDLICRDQLELESWFGGLKGLISTKESKHSTDEGSIDGNFFYDGGDSGSSYRGSGRRSLDGSRISRSFKSNSYSRDPSLSLPRSDGYDHANMQLRSNNGDGLRLSVSSAPSSSSQGSGPDDIESLGDVYVWGEIWSDGLLPDGSIPSSVDSKGDVLLPKPLESNVVLDVHQIACGVRYAALVTRQGEVFTWGKESGGQLGHGNDKDISRPRLVESLSTWSMDYVACGEYHTCAISTAGDLFTWGDGSHYTGLLGQSNDISHWMPKRVSGPLEGLQILSVACGIWHSALVTSHGKVYTFGDGAFGVLGHGDRSSTAYPREIEALSGLRTLKVACGVWHTAAIVEVMGQTGVNVISRKLFTWGDGDKYRLGHGDKEPRLIPTCISSLIDYNFHQVACGYNFTVGLTTSGHVFTMGSTSHGQLGNPMSDGVVPHLVQDRLIGELVEEISCGAFHVAVITSRSEVYTWGLGANGRLGHGDADDRKTPTLVEALKERHVKSISCGSNFTACICIHKWVSGADQSVCSGCRQPFGFTRKRHNCYNCGLVHCHACSSKKVLKAALAPTPGKPHRVCDSCYSKLKAAESGNYSNMASKKSVVPRRSVDGKERLEHVEIRSSRLLLPPNADPSRFIEAKFMRNDMKSADSASPLRSPQVPSLLQLKDIPFPGSLTALQTALKPILTSTAPVQINTKPTSPFAMRPSPPMSVATPVISKSIIDSLKQTNELLNQEVLKLQAQVQNLRQKCEYQDAFLKKSVRKAEESASKCTAAVEVVKSLDAQLKDIAEKLPSDVGDCLKATCTQAESFLKLNEHQASEAASSSITDSSANDQPYSTGEGSSMHEQRIDTASAENGTKSPRSSTTRQTSDGETELTEQFEPGVYVTFIQLRDGTKVFKRVRFSKRRFGEQQAEDWWNKNQERVFKKYTCPQGTAPTLSSSVPTD